MRSWELTQSEMLSTRSLQGDGGEWRPSPRCFPLLTGGSSACAGSPPLRALGC